MAEQGDPNVPQGAAATSSSLSETISELLQSPTQVDIAGTLGLLDDPSNPIAGGGLDTSAMLDPSTFLQPPSTVVSSAQTVTGTTNPSSTRKSITSSSPSKSLEAISNRLLQGLSSSVVSSGKGASVSLTQKPQHLASGSATVDDSSKKVTVPPPASDTVADLTSIINSMVSQEQQAVATVLTPSTLSQSTTTSSPGSIPNPVPIPSATHIPHSATQDSTEQKSSISEQRESIKLVSMAIPSLGDLCKSLGVNISKESPLLRVPAPATCTSLSTTPTTVASLPPTAAVGKTEREPNATVIDQSTAPKLDSGVSNVTQEMASSEHTAVVTDGSSLQQPASSLQHDNMQQSSAALSVSRGTESVSSVSGVPDEAKKLKSADSAGKPTAIPTSFLAAIQLQPASAQKSPLAEAAGSSQLQAPAALPQTLTPKLPISGTAPSLATSALPASVTVGKSTPPQSKATNGSSSVQAQSQATQKAIVSSLSSQKQGGVDIATKMVSAATMTPAVVSPAATKTTVSRQMPTTTPAANTVTPPTATPTTGAISKSQQTSGSSVQMDSSAMTTPKNINLPILQFLQANFPALPLGALTAGGGAGKGGEGGRGERGGGGGGGGNSSNKEVLQVQTLLAHVLQQQQQLQQLQQQAQQQVQKAIASGQPLPGTSNGKPTLDNIQWEIFAGSIFIKSQFCKNMYVYMCVCEYFRLIFRG